MKLRTPLIFTALLVSIVAVGQNEYMQKYAGTYRIMVTGYASKEDSEAYTLKADGSAAWIYGYKDQAGKVQTQQKYGTWTAKDGMITVTIRGNTGNISETYGYKNGRFVNAEESARYLKKI